MNIQEILDQYKNGNLSLEAATSELQGFVDIGHSRIDIGREARNGQPEVIYGEGKTAQQIIEIISVLKGRGSPVLATRVSASNAAAILENYPQAQYHELSRMLTVPEPNYQQDTASTRIAICCAGTTDLPVAEEARLTAEFYGNPVETVYDAGVAGLHRLLASIERIRACKVVVVVAGMEAALASVVGGLVKAPIIAVPTSVGYGAHFNGVTALLGMLNSCASGVSVVNIDNGFGAGFLANRINRL